MAEISKITLPNGSVYDLKSNVANKFSSNRTIKLTGDVTGSTSSNGENGWSIATTVGDDSHNHTTQTIVPRITKSYTGVIASANNDANCHMYYFKVVPDSYAGQWSIKYRVYATIDGVSTGNGSGFEESVVYISGMRNTYSAYRTWNNISNTSYRPYYYHTFYRAKEAGISYGHLLGVSLRYAYNPTTTTNTRNVTFEILDYEGCIPTFFDSPIVYANASGTGSTNYDGLTTFDATTAGLTTSGDRNDVNWQNRENYSSRTTKNALYRYQICLTDSTGQLIPINSVNNSVATDKVLTTDAFDPFGEIFYWSSTSTYNAGANVGNSSLFRQIIADLRYSFNCGGYDTTPTLTARLPLYLVASPQTDGTAKLHSSPLSQTLPVSDDGLIYIYLGRVYEDTKPYRVVLSIHHPVYWYKDGAVRQYIQRAENANNAVSATSATTATKLNSTRSFTIGKTAKNVDWSGAVSFSQAEISDNASTSAAGWMSKDDKTKLNGIETGAQVNTITGVKGGSESSYRTGNVNITATNIGLGNLTNNKQVKGLSSGTTNNNLVAWGSDGYTVADSGIAKGSVTTKLALSGTNYSASSNTITVTKANLQSAVQDSSLVLMTAAERTKLASIDTSGNYVTIGGAQTITGAKTFTQKIQIGQDANPLFFIKPTSISFHHARSESSSSFFVGDQRDSFNNYEFTSSYPDRVVANDSTFLQAHYIINTDYNIVIRDEDSNNISYTSIDGRKIYGDFTQGAKYSIQYTTSSEVLGFHYGTASSTQSYGGRAAAFGTSVAGGYLSYAEGEEGKALGEASHVEGYLSQSIGYYSHAQGKSTHAEGEASHSQGYGTNADGKYAHVQGRFSSAKGQASHAQGDSTAIGRFSHSEGADCYAIGDRSHAGGWGTYATRNSQTVIGKYNKLIGSSSATSPVCSNDLLCGNDVLVGGDTLDSGDYAFIIGNGQSYAQRSNLLMISQQTHGTQGFISIWNPRLSIETAPSSDNNNIALYLGDKDGNRMGCIAYNHNSEGDIGIILQGYRKYNNNNIYNTLNLSIDSSGNNKVVVSSPAAWRKALELQIPTISLTNTIVPGYISNGSKDVTLSVPLNKIPYGTPKITYLAISLRGGSGQEYLYEASGSSNNTYTQLGTSPVTIWENSRTKRTNGVENISVSNQGHVGLYVNIRFKNTLRKTASTTVAQNNAPYGIVISATINFT